jgi:hypothetical protein
MTHLTPEDREKIAQLGKATPPGARLLTREATLRAKFPEIPADTLAAILFDVLQVADMAEDLGVETGDVLAVTVYDLAKMGR